MKANQIKKDFKNISHKHATDGTLKNFIADEVAPLTDTEIKEHIENALINSNKLLVICIKYDLTIREDFFGRLFIEADALSFGYDRELKKDIYYHTIFNLSTEIHGEAYSPKDVYIRRYIEE